MALDSNPVSCCSKVMRIRKILDEYEQQGFLRTSEYIRDEINRRIRGTRKTVTELYRAALAGSQSCNRPIYQNDVCSTCYRNSVRKSAPDTYTRNVDVKDRNARSREYNFRLRVKETFEKAIADKPDLTPDEREELYRDSIRRVKKRHAEFRDKVRSNKTKLGQKLTLDGKTYSLARWALINKVSEQTVLQRLQKGIPDYVAVRDVPNWVLNAYSKNDELGRMRQEVLKRPSLIDAGKLTAKQRQVMRVVYGERLSMQDAADKLGLTKQDVNQVERRCLQIIFRDYPLEVELKTVPKGSILPSKTS